MARTIEVDRLIDERPVSGFQIRVVVVCALVALLDGLDTMSIGIAAPAMAREFHWAPPQLAPVFSLGLLGGMVGALAMGPIADRFGRKWPMVISALMMAVGTLGSATAHGLPDLIAWRVLAGAGMGAANPCFIALTSEYAPARLRGALVAAMWAAFPLGGVLGGFVNPALISAGGWRLMFEIGGAASLLVTLGAALACPESLRYLAHRRAAAERFRAILRRMAPDAAVADAFVLSEERTEARAGVAQLFASGLAVRTLLLWVIFAVNFAALGFTPLWAPTLFSRPGGLGLAESALVVSAWNLGSVMGAGGSGRLYDLFSPPRVMALLFVGAAVFAALLGGFGSHHALTPAILTALAANLCLGAASSGALTVAASVYPTALRSTGIGWAMGLGRAGQVAGSALAGALLAAQWTGQQLYMTLGAAALVAALACFAFSGRARARVQAAA